MNPDFTFDVFLCVTILIENRGSIFKCTDASDVYQLTSRYGISSMKTAGAVVKNERDVLRYYGPNTYLALNYSGQLIL